MTIAICGSLQFYREMEDAANKLRRLGHVCHIPKGVELIAKNQFVKPKTVEERLAAEAKYDFIRSHFKQIEQSEAILVLNYDKNGIAGYIGGNTLMEMAIAFYLGKKIYLYAPVPDQDYCRLEVYAMHPVVIDGDFAKIT